MFPLLMLRNIIINREFLIMNSGIVMSVLIFITTLFSVLGYI